VGGDEMFPPLQLAFAFLLLVTVFDGRTDPTAGARVSRPQHFPHAPIIRAVGVEFVIIGGELRHDVSAVLKSRDPKWL